VLRVCTWLNKPKAELFIVKKTNNIPEPTEKNEKNKPIVSDKISSGIAINWKRLAFIALIIVLVASAALMSVVLVKKKTQTTKKQTVVATNQKEAGDIIHEKVIDSTTPQDAKQNMQELELSAKNTTDPTTQSSYYLGIANIALNSGDYTKCIDYGKKADEAQKTLANAGTIAECAMQKKDYNLAAEWYGFAADRSPKVNNPNLNAPYNDYIRLQKEAKAKA
jgi:hypothetical protein